MPDITPSTTNSRIPLPSGAVLGDDWPTHRVILSAREPHIIVVAPQYNGVNGLNANQARELAAALLAAADELDACVGVARAGGNPQMER